MHRENEAGLLEALQQSMDCFESDAVSDFAQLSSTLSSDLADTSAIPYIPPNIKTSNKKEQSVVSIEFPYLSVQVIYKRYINFF